MNGMAEVISDTLSKHRKYVRNEDYGGVICDECGWEVASKWPEANFGKSTAELASEHESFTVFTALTKAGYGPFLSPDPASEKIAPELSHGVIET